MFNFNLPLRILQTLLSVVAIGLNAYVVKWYLAHTSTHTTPDEAPFLIFAASWTILLLPYFYLNPALSLSTQNKPSGRFFNKYVLFALDLLTSALWLGGFIALAVFKHKLIICGGHVCTIMIAGVVIGAITWATFLATTTLALLHILRTRRGPVNQTVNKEAHQDWVGNTNTQQTAQVSPRARSGPAKINAFVSAA